jgi:hypothetical protein
MARQNFMEEGLEGGTLLTSWWPETGRKGTGIRHPQ